MKYKKIVILVVILMIVTVVVGVLLYIKMNKKRVFIRIGQTAINGFGFHGIEIYDNGKVKKIEWGGEETTEIKQLSTTEMNQIKDEILKIDFIRLKQEYENAIKSRGLEDSPSYILDIKMDNIEKKLSFYASYEPKEFTELQNFINKIVI